MRAPWDQIDSWLMSFCNFWTSDELSIVRQFFTSSANITASHERPFKQSFMCIKKRTGPSTEPCGTPLKMSINLEYPSPILTRSVLFVRKLCIHLWSLPSIPSWSNFCSNLRWGTQSKAFLKSKYIISTPDFLFKARDHCSREFRRFVRHDLPCLKPCCLVPIICLESTNRVRATLIMRSITFRHMLVRSPVGSFSDLHADPLCNLAIRWLSANLLVIVQNPVKSEKCLKGGSWSPRPLKGVVECHPGLGIYLFLRDFKIFFT